MPPYPGVRQVMEITANAGMMAKPAADTDGIDKHKENNGDDDWALQYASYCAEKEANEFKLVNNDEDKLEEKNNDNQSNSEGDDDWALQYQNYCIEKEARLKEEEERQKKVGNAGDEEDWAVQYANYLEEKGENDEKLSDTKSQSSSSNS